MRNDMISRIVSFLLAIGIVAGIVWMMSNSVNFAGKGATPASENTTTESRTAMEPNGTLNRNTQQAAEVDEPGQIYKCMSNNKATYSDKKCLTSENATRVRVRETSGGFASPDAQTIADTRARIRAEMQQSNTAVVGNKVGPSIASDECGYLSDQINAIDSDSRQRHTGQGQQQLRISREQIRTRQFRLGC